MELLIECPQMLDPVNSKDLRLVPDSIKMFSRACTPEAVVPLEQGCLQMPQSDDHQTTGLLLELETALELTIAATVVVLPEAGPVSPTAASPRSTTIPRKEQKARNHLLLVGSSTDCMAALRQPGVSVRTPSPALPC